jgi:hypothetical protein
MVIGIDDPGAEPGVTRAAKAIVKRERALVADLIAAGLGLDVVQPMFARFLPVINESSRCRHREW